MRKHKHNTPVKQGITVKKRAGERTFAYRVPPEVVGRLPAGATVTLVSLDLQQIFELARQVEPRVIRHLTAQPAKNALEALLLMVRHIYGLLEHTADPVIAHKEMIELAERLASTYEFSAAWPYTRAQMQAAMTPGHPDLRPDIADEHILVTASEVEKLLIAKLAEEGVTVRDATQSGMTLVVLIQDLLFGKSPVFGADHHELYHIARVLVASYTFSRAWPYSNEQVKQALVALFKLPS